MLATMKIVEKEPLAGDFRLLLYVGAFKMRCTEGVTMLPFARFFTGVSSVPE